MGLNSKLWEKLQVPTDYNGAYRCVGCFFQSYNGHFGFMLGFQFIRHTYIRIMWKPIYKTYQVKLVKLSCSMLHVSSEII